jgi:hypothetical protein
MQLTVTPESRSYASKGWLVGCLARLAQSSSVRRFKALKPLVTVLWG